MRCTIHKIRKIDEVPSLFRIIIGQKTVVNELPSKSIRNYDDDSSVGGSGGLGGVGIQPVQGGDFTSRGSLVDMTIETIGTRHFIRFGVLRILKAKKTCGIMKRRVRSFDMRNIDDRACPDRDAV